ncbi:MAG: glycosyltransferase [Candidatus Pacebacteria bacterium]|nr:glycosyltransferase [Candidatus Paceibacterota bacterium]MDD5357050.1 glycosyltransferase [Candidatus Paceibacterota bacterium]
MKIAVFHNFMDNIGGAEMVTLTLARGLDADVYTTNLDEEKIRKMGFGDVIPRIISLGKVPKNAPFRHQLSFWKFRRLNLGKKYDFYIIAGDWAMSGAVHNKPNLWYAHSPLNEIWQFKDYIRSEILSWWKRPFFDTWVWWNRKLTLRYAKHIGEWICNSENTKARIKKYYHHDARVINPPVDLSQSEYKPHRNYCLSVNRLSPPKRIDLQMKAFSNMPGEKLIIVGSFEKGARQPEAQKKYIESIKPQNVKILHWVDQGALRKLYSECKCFITTALDEDFGMTPVEAMGFGKPVIAPNEGGYKETIVNGKTGILIDDINTDKIVEAVKEISKNPEKYKNASMERAREFDVEIFIRKIISLMKN